MDPHIQGEILTELPIILEKSAHLVLVLLVVLVRYHRRTLEPQVLRTRDSKRLVDMVDRTGQMGQQISSCRRRISREAGKCGSIQIGYRIVSWTEGYERRETRI